MREIILHLEDTTPEQFRKWFSDFSSHCQNRQGEFRQHGTLRLLIEKLHRDSSEWETIAEINLLQIANRLKVRIGYSDQANYLSFMREFIETIGQDWSETKETIRAHFDRGEKMERGVKYIETGKGITLTSEPPAPVKQEKQKARYPLTFNEIDDIVTKNLDTLNPEIYQVTREHRGQSILYTVTKAGELLGRYRVNARSDGGAGYGPIQGNGPEWDMIYESMLFWTLQRAEGTLTPEMEKNLEERQEYYRMQIQAIQPPGDGGQSGDDAAQFVNKMATAVSRVTKQIKLKDDEGDVTQINEKGITRGEYRTNNEFTIPGLTLRVARDILHGLAYKENDPAMIVLFHEPGSLPGAIKLMSTSSDGRRVADELHRGTFKITPTQNPDGIRIVFQRGDFPDGGLFTSMVNKIARALGAEQADDGLIRKRKHRKDVVSRVALALYLQEKERLSWRVAADKARTTTDAMNQYENLPDVQSVLAKFKEKPEDAILFRKKLPPRRVRKQD